MTTRLLITSRTFGLGAPEVVQRLRDAGADVVSGVTDKTLSEEQLLAIIGDTEVLLAGTEPVTARVIAAAPRLRAIVRHGVGYDNVDLAAAKARGIPVGAAVGAISESVADMTLGLILALARHIPQTNAAVRAGAWPRIIGFELPGKTLGIVGLGAIGKAVCRRASGFGMHVIAYDPYPDHAFAQANGVAFVTLEELLARADVITLHALVTDQTRGMINARTLSLMKRTAYLINTGRGELVDETALLGALRAQTIAGAACDVFVKEPPVGSELLTLENFIATPHSSGMTVEGQQRMAAITVENVLRVLRNEPPMHRVA